MAKSPAGAVTHSLPAKRKSGVGSVGTGPLAGVWVGRRRRGKSRGLLRASAPAPFNPKHPGPARETEGLREPGSEMPELKRGRGGGRGRERQDEGGEPGVFPPRAARGNRRPAEWKSRESPAGTVVKYALVKGKWKNCARARTGELSKLHSHLTLRTGRGAPGESAGPSPVPRPPAPRGSRGRSHPPGAPRCSSSRIPSPEAA